MIKVQRPSIEVTTRSLKRSTFPLESLIRCALRNRFTSAASPQTYERTDTIAEGSGCHHRRRIGSWVRKFEIGSLMTRAERIDHSYCGRCIRLLSHRRSNAGAFIATRDRSMSALGRKRKCSERANDVRFPLYSDRTLDAVLCRLRADTVAKVGSQ